MRAAAIWDLPFYAAALEREETLSYHFLIALCRSEIGVFIPLVAKSNVTSAVMSAAENRSPVTNLEFANLTSRSS
jgi:hypothetical protein